MIPTDTFSVPASWSKRFASLREVIASVLPRRQKTLVAVKKLVPEMRKPKPQYLKEQNFFRRLLARLQEDSQFQRTAVQSAFLLLVIWIGIEFHLFMQWGLSGGTEPYVSRPPGVDGFLPIGALMSFWYFLQTGTVHSIHPAGFFILAAIISIGAFLKKGFCSWLCPIGFLSEGLWLTGRKIFKRNFNLPKWIDFPLRGLKYLLLFFFAYHIFTMDASAILAFLESPYYKVADIKMYQFFAEISSFSFKVIFGLVVISLFVQNAWCRFLCPYGAFLGIMSWLSPVKIARNPKTCIDCNLCTKACPSLIKVHSKKRVWSDECTACYRCVDVCPVKETLELKSSFCKKSVPSWVFASLAIGLFVAITGLAMLAGKWQNSVSKEEYLRHFKNINSSVYQHSMGRAPSE